MRILVTGATGFLGRHLMPVLANIYGTGNHLIGVSSKDYDLLERSNVMRMFREICPTHVIHLAAYSGGIGANRALPADFYYRNTILTAHVFEEAARNSVSKMIYTMGGCSYPAKAVSPISEDQMWEGYPQPESSGYSVAKKMGIVASKSYRSQYGLNSVVLIPGNMYGEFDNFRNEESHVVPAMLRRYHEAKRDGLAKVSMWGSGTPTRDFVYAADVAKCIPFFLDSYDSSEPVNLSSGTSTSIRELAETIKVVTGYDGIIDWDSTKPDGQMVKIFDTGRMESLALKCPTSLLEGLGKTALWLRQNYDARSDGLRLDPVTKPGKAV